MNDALAGIPTTALVRVVSGPGLITPGTSAVYVLEMLGYSPGAAVFNARITSNDADENPYLFTVKGNVTGGIVPPVDDPPLFLGPPVAVDPAAGNP